MTEWTLNDALTVLAALVQDTSWHQPLRCTQTEALRTVAIYIRNRIEDEPHPGAEDLALMWSMDALLHWLVDPEDETRIQRFRRAYEIYVDFLDLADEAS